MALTGLTQLQPNNIQVVGIATFDQSVGIAGTLTYQDVTNVDAVGIVTARSGIDVSAGDLTINDKIVHAGDTNTTLRFPSADMITAETAGTERLRIQADGDVSFGDETTGRAQIKHLSGDQANRNAGGFPQYAFVGNEGTGMRRVSSNVLAFDTTGEERIRINSGGSIGIGTDNPAYGLDVRVDNFTKAQFKGKGANENNIPFYIMSGTSAVQLGIEPLGGQEKIILQASDDSMRFHTAGEERLRINNVGHVAIGTDFPNAALPLTIQGQYPGIQFRDNEGSTAFNINADANEFRIQTGHAGNSPSPRLVINSSGDVLPGSDADLDLGSSSKRWANIYTADLQLSNKGNTNDVDGTWGQYTIQEGEDDLFLINKRNGKKYKFMLEEVN